MSGNNMSLKNLTMFDFSDEKFAAYGAKVEAEIQEYKAKYGEDWYEHWSMDNARKREIKQAADMKLFVNGRMYDYGCLQCSRHERFPQSFHDAFDQRAHEVYGDEYDELCANPVQRNPRVAELLIQDALRTGDWQSLPEELIPIYHERVGGAS